ncbi:SPOSA6832_03708, partial [Sporobolomyces salmonicolor]
MRLPRLSTSSIPPQRDTADSHASAEAPLLPVSQQRHDDKKARLDRQRHSHHGGQYRSPQRHPLCSSSTIKSHKRQHRLASLAHTSAVFCLAVTSLIAAGVVTWAGWFLYTRHNAYAKAVFAPPMAPRPAQVEALVNAFDLSGRSFPLGTDPSLSVHTNSTSSVPLAAVQAELDSRLLSLALAPTSLACPSLASPPSLAFNATRYSSLPSSGPYLLALNLYNSQSVLPTLARTLLAVADYLGRQNVHISIFENGSTDSTTMGLAHLAAALSAMGVEHTIVSDPRPTDWKRVDRIDQLAVYRNVALAPVQRGLLSSARAFEDVLFINDVFVCPSDALELLWQRKEQDADAACAMDWRESKGVFGRWSKSVKFYDNWVSRSISGNMLRARLDVFSEARDGVAELFDQPGEEPSRDRFRRGLPVPVYSCWNGMLALKAEPFRTTDINPRASQRLGPTGAGGGVGFRTAQAPTRFRSALRSLGECAASECKTLARDFWARGYDRWLIVPTVRATYVQSTYTHPRLLSLISRAQAFLAGEESPDSKSPADPVLAPRIDWSLPEWTAPKNVMCWSWARGFHIDLQWWRMTRERPWRR